MATEVQFNKASDYVVAYPLGYVPPGQTQLFDVLSPPYCWFVTGYN